MKKRKIAAMLLAFSLALGLCACGTSTENDSQKNENTITVAATTYPIYALAQIATAGHDNFAVTLVVDQQVSCLHDYTLSVKDMRIIEQADVILMNGVGFEDFMQDALRSVSATVIDCSEGIDLLPYEGHADHAHGDDESDSNHYDPHIWLDPNRMFQMLGNITYGLAALDDTLEPIDQMKAAALQTDALMETWQARFDALPEAQKSLITFHDGFAYLADAFGLHLLHSIEEEAGSEASAKEIVEIVELVKTYDIPMIFVEKNGSDATAKAIQRETGVEIGTLSMLMSASENNLWKAIEENLTVIYEGLTAQEVDALEK